MGRKHSVEERSDNSRMKGYIEMHIVHIRKLRIVKGYNYSYYCPYPNVTLIFISFYVARHDLFNSE